MMTQGPDVRAGITFHPEENKSSVSSEHLKFMNLPDPQSPFDSTASGGPLIDPSGKMADYFGKIRIGHISLQPEQCNILLIVLMQNGCEPYCPAKENDKDARDLWIKRPGMSDG
jgi:hypothetical protein